MAVLQELMDKIQPLNMVMMDAPNRREAQLAKPPAAWVGWRICRFS